MFPHLRQIFAQRERTGQVFVLRFGWYKFSRHCHGIDTGQRIFDGQQNLCHSSGRYDRYEYRLGIFFDIYF